MLKLNIAEKKANSSRAGSSNFPTIKSFTFEDTEEASVKSGVKEAQTQIVKPTFLDETSQEDSKRRSSSILHHSGSILNSTIVEPFTLMDFQQQSQPSSVGTEKVTFDRQQTKYNQMLGNKQPAVVKPKVAVSDPPKGPSTSSQPTEPAQDVRCVYLKAPPQPVQTTESFRSNLPKLKLREYSGDPLEWPEWVGLFQLTVVHAVNITDKMKMQHLKTLVTGKSKEAIAGLGF